MTPDDPAAPSAPDRARPTVRRAAPGDGPALRRLQRHLREPSPDLLEYGLAVGDVRVAVRDGEVVGYALPVAGGDGVHVSELAVAPGHRREGNATALLWELVADADGPVTLLVAPDNEPARTLYDDLGFSVVERRPDAFAEGDALLMRRG